MGRSINKLTDNEKFVLNQLLHFLDAHRFAYFKDFEKIYSEDRFFVVDREKAAKFLRKYGADVNFKNKYHKTPLYSAVCFGSEKIVQILIENGANINKEDKDGKTPLIAAICKGYEKIVQILVENGANVNHSKPESSKIFQTKLTPLHYAVNKGNQE
ncbi:myotrophin-like [Sitodiplosis mosellana]|uniref:myotrophin-like n=1 Tax=Sitodiplosis mosellana TaxID=263140 RepID=UPI0024446F10|nr:myotrophin-like [Sitodiplosis mosellana]